MLSEQHPGEGLALGAEHGAVGVPVPHGETPAPSEHRPGGRLARVGSSTTSSDMFSHFPGYFLRELLFIRCIEEE